MCSMRRIVCIAAIIEIKCLGPAQPHPQLTQHILAADSCLKCRQSVSLAEPHMQRINVHLRTAASACCRKGPEQERADALQAGNHMSQRRAA